MITINWFSLERCSSSRMTDVSETPLASYELALVLTQCGEWIHDIYRLLHDGHRGLDVALCSRHPAPASPAASARPNPREAPVMIATDMRVSDSLVARAVRALFDRRRRTSSPTLGTRTAVGIGPGACPG